MPGISNNEIKRIRSLSVKKFRDQEGLFTVEGEKMVSEARESAFHIEAIYRTEEIGQEAMSRISALSSPSPVLAVVRKPEGLTLGDRGQILSALVPAAKGKSVHEVFPERGHTERHSGLFLALDTIRDPGNLGTIIRTANAAGYADIYAVNCADAYSPKVVRASMSGIFFVNIYDCTLDDALSVLRDVPVITADMGGENIFTFNAPEKFCLCIGNEGGGVSDRIKALSEFTVKIPMRPTCESLNAGVSAAIAMYALKNNKI